ncbi:hypothetical protein MMC14_004384 [Varicellaria rhodocarpa]|nr:hypothetical protein [Varicellaria rhodocarpa]
MAITEEYPHQDLSFLDNDDCERAFSPLPASTVRNLDFVRDIQERPYTASNKSPAPPELKNSGTGFPAHTERFNRSAFKQQRAKHVSRGPQYAPAFTKTLKSTSVGTSLLGKKQLDPHGSEIREIDRENKKRLAQMSPMQIERERTELLAGLSSSLIERLLKKANIEDHGASEGMDSNSVNVSTEVILGLDNSPSALKHLPERVAFEELSEKSTERVWHAPSSSIMNPDAAPLAPLPDPNPASSQLPLPSPSELHFPQECPSPSLDPSDPDFVVQLRTKYFPDLPVDPAKMAWMAPIPSEDSPADRDSPYNPSQEFLHPSSIRFDFKGRLIPPRLARQIPATKGLHHHGLAPEAAGYTVPELAHLSRSAVAAQRCIAYQTLGRILFRLGRGDFEEESDELYLGLWKCIEEGRILDTLSFEADAEDDQGNRTCKAIAAEAIWLWKKGGGKRQKAT